MSLSQQVLVTGGAGFIGSHLCERLLKKNFEVLCLDNFNDFYDPKLKENNISTASNHKNFTLIRGDILDKDLLENIFHESKIRKVVHLAAITGVRSSILEPAKYAYVDIMGTINLLESVRKYKIEQFIFGSSSSVYGINQVPFSEKDKVDLQISPYATAKRAAELYCATYHHLYRIPITILRFFTVYGPRQRPDMVIHKFTRLMTQGKSIPVFGNGESKRDYTYISDAIDGIIKSMEKKRSFEIFNIGNSEMEKLADIIKIISDKIGIQPKIDYLPKQLGDVPITCADISKAKKVLGYAPIMSIKEGIENFVEWYLGYFDGNNQNKKVS